MLGPEPSSDARADRDRDVFEHERLDERCPDARFRGANLIIVANVRKDDGELVSTETGGLIAFASNCLQAAGRFAYQFVAGLMAICIIDLLEVVEVDEQKAHLPAPGGGLPAKRAGAALERADDVARDPPAIEVAGLRADAPALWGASVAIRDTSIVDVFWGAGFVVIAWVTFAASDGSADRRLLLAVLTTVWGLRLTVHLARRNLGHGEDPRYRAMRERHGERWPRRSLWAVFWGQGLLMWIVSLPVQAGQAYAEPGSLIWLELLGTAIWLLGFLFETIGDLQLTRFRADPANAGRVMDRGLWRYTRHPNYFGDFSVWWGLFLIALATVSAWWTVIGPIVMSVLLIRVSGAALLERSMGKTRPGYEDYVGRTSGFLPRPPKRA